MDCMDLAARRDATPHAAVILCWILAATAMICFRYFTRYENLWWPTISKGVKLQSATGYYLMANSLEWMLGVSR